MTDKAVISYPSSHDARDWLRFVSVQLAEKLPDTAMHEARLLLALAVGREAPILTHEDIHLDSAARKVLQSVIDARLSGVPFSRLRGWREFYGLRFSLNSDTLDPRPDSEVLVASAVAFARNMGWQDTPISIADLGTGSGCLLLSCLHELPMATGLGLDVSAGAVKQAKDNADALGLSARAEFLQSDWDAELRSEQFDIILSNPPYIETGAYDNLADEVRLHDPHRALFAGTDGLQDYRKLMPIIAARLETSGRAFIELGFGQEGAVSALAQAAGLHIVSVQNDLAGIARCLILKHG